MVFVDFDRFHYRFNWFWLNFPCSYTGSFDFHWFYLNLINFYNIFIEFDGFRKHDYEQGRRARRLINDNYLACICILQKSHFGSSLLVQDAFASLRLDSRRGLGTMPLLASSKTRKQLNADKRARDAEKAFARDQSSGFVGSFFSSSSVSSFFQ